MTDLQRIFLFMSTAGLLTNHAAFAQNYPVIVTETPSIPSSMNVGTTYGPYVYTIQNNYYQPLSAHIGGIDGTVVTVATATSNPCGSSIAPHSSCNLAINIHPTSAETLQESPWVEYGLMVHTPLPSLNITVSASSYIFVSDYEENKIYTFPLDSSGAVTPTYTLGDGTSSTIDGPLGLWVDADQNLWVANFSNHNALKYSSWSGDGQSPDLTVSVGGQVEYVAFSGGGSLYVANTGNVSVYTDPAGSRTGTNNFATGSLWTPSEGSSFPYYVADTSGSIYKFDANAIGSPTPTQTITSSSMSRPSGMWVDKDGNVWAIDTDFFRILEFAPNAGTGATPICTIESPSINTPMSIVVDSTGNVYELDDSGEVNVFAPGDCGDSVTPVRSFTLAGGFTDAEGLAIYDPGLLTHQTHRSS